MNLCNITASSVMFFSPTDLAASVNVNFDVTDTKRATLSVHKFCGNRLDDRVHSRRKG